jgi:hypothetical protein
MKTNHLITSLCAAALVLFSACGKTENGGGAATAGSSGGSATVRVDTSKFNEAFKSAAADVKPVADAVVSAVKSADYSAATAKLQDLASKYKITPEQQQAVTDLLSQVQKALGGAAAKATDAANKAADGASKAANDLGNALKK